MSDPLTGSVTDPLTNTGSNSLSWLGIVRLGLIQASLGAIVVLTTSTMNRVMVVELSLAAVLPGALVGLHYAIQLLRPRFGYGSDLGQRRTPWIVGGMATLALGGVGASLSIALMSTALVPGILAAVLSFVVIGAGVGAAGTSLIVLLATRVDETRRPAAATIVWVMMIAGFVVTTVVAGHMLDPFSMARLVTITGMVAAGAVVVTVLAIIGLEPRSEKPSLPSTEPTDSKTPFRTAFAQVWSEPRARLFTLFVVTSMLGYSAQDLILEPYAGLLFGYSPGQSTQLAGVQHGGALLGMLVVGFLGTLRPVRRFISIRSWTVGGCLASAAALVVLAFGGFAGPGWPLAATVFCLGTANGVFAVAAIGSMMTMAGQGRARREGVRMGLWGAAQALAMGFGGLLGAAGVDLIMLFSDQPVLAYGSVFVIEAGLFVFAALLAMRISGTHPASRRHSIGRVSEHLVGVSQQ
ncbi:MAG: BCD family MFS transporter [Xanthomonadales bacterium]|nr:BCD family MFS transporter [Xanthomonadales bacterium]